MRVLIVTLVVMTTFAAFGQTLESTPDGKAATTANSAGTGAAGVCNEAHEGGSFPARYSWYVQGVQRKIGENWVKYEQDTQVQSASRICLKFDINRSGEPSNVQIVQSSGVPLLDESALRAVNKVSSFGPLPREYERDKVSVLFWFDYNSTFQFDYKPTRGEQKNKFAISPPNSPVTAGSSQQFFVTVQSILIWTVDGPACAKADCGSISATGLYSAPLRPPSPPEINVTVIQTQAPFESDSVKVTIVASKAQN